MPWRARSLWLSVAAALVRRNEADRYVEALLKPFGAIELDAVPEDHVDRFHDVAALALLDAVGAPAGARQAAGASP